MNRMAIGFVGVLAVVGLGVDYQQQSLRAGVPLGQFGLAAYKDSITGRFNAMKDEKAAKITESKRLSAWREGGKPYLPEPFNGWERRSFAEGDITAIVPVKQAAKRQKDHDGARYLADAIERQIESKRASAGVLNLMSARSAGEVRADVDKRAWVYQRGDETVLIEASLRKDPGIKSLIGVTSAMFSGTVGMIADGRREGFAVIGGVPFIELKNDNGQIANHYRILEGSLGFGSEVRLRVHANASTASTRELLAAIDYDGMNALLPRRLDTVGNGVKVKPGLSEAKLAQDMRRLKMEFTGLRMMEAQYRIKHLNGGSLMVQGMTGGMAPILGVGSGPVDMDDMIRAGYRAGLRDLMEGGDANMAMQEMSMMIGMAIAQAGADTGKLAGALNDPVKIEGKMSPELAAELGLLQQEDAAAQAPQAGGMAAMARAEPAAKAPAGGGFMSSIKGLFGGGGDGGNATPAAATRENVTVRKMGGESTRIVRGGCGAGQFCEAKN